MKECRIKHCPNCSSDLWHGSEQKLNLYGCPSCGFIFKIQPIEPRPVEGGKTIFIGGVK